MGGIIACICCYCCLTTLKPKTIEIIALLCNIVSIGFLIWGVVDIPWNDISTAGKIFFFITCGCVVVTLIFLLGLMCIRCSGKINTSKNSSAKCLCITMIVFDILAFILIIISEIIIFYNMDDKDYDYYYDDYNYRRRRTKYSNREWAASVISISAAEIAIICHSYCANFLLKLISAKTDTSYLDYMEQKEDNNIVSRTINVMNQPTNNVRNNQLTFIGYDKNGHPIYQGNTQYFTSTATNSNANGK
jgi:hypothetical protein